MSFTETETDVDGGPLRITITPYQSAYFAGEHFAVTITFTNTLTPSSVLPKSASTTSLSRTHKRGSHSVSSAPLARPPTSPGLQTLRQGQSAALKSEKPLRKGLIGVGIGSARDDRLGELYDSKRRNAHGRSLSVHISPTDLERHLSQYSLSPATPSSGISPISNKSPANETRGKRSLIYNLHIYPISTAF
jgi:RAB6A-GEF complex partner protein 2